MADLNTNQKECVGTDGNLLITACPGSGKTTVLAHRAERLLLENPDKNLLAVTFTKDAANELKSRIVKRIPSAEKRVSAGTFHSLAKIQLNRAGLNYKIISERDSIQILNTIIEQLGIDENFKAQMVTELFAKFKASASADQHPELIKSKELSEIWKRYAHIKEINRSMDFSDMLYLAVKHTEAGLVKPFNAHFILGDESQDMDAIQHTWIDQHAYNGSQVTLVGDDDQSIYGWRSAEGYNGMMNFLKKHNANKVVLPINYRCGKLILSKAATLIENNKQRVDKPIEAGMKFDGTLYKPITGTLVEKSDPTIIEREEEYEKVINFIMDKWLDDSVQFDQWAVLSRGKMNLKNFEMICAENNIVTHRDDGSIWDSVYGSTYLGVLNYIALRDWYGMAAFLNMIIVSDNLFSVPNCDLEKLYEIEEKISVKNAQILDQMLDYEFEWDEWMKEDEEQGAEKVIEDVGNLVLTNFQNKPKMNEKSKITAEGVINYCMELLKKKSGNLRRRLFLETNPMAQKSDPVAYKKSLAEEKNVPFLHLMTMHKSKGLEFENVFLLGCDDDSMLKPDENTGLVNEPEERRLFYVAMTRAKKHLAFSCSSINGTKNSTFLNEIGFG